jgi:hypothetical protein
MVSSGLLRRVDLVRTDVSEEPGASFVAQQPRRHHSSRLRIDFYFIFYISEAFALLDVARTL